MELEDHEPKSPQQRISKMLAKRSTAFLQFRHFVWRIVTAPRRLSRSWNTADRLEGRDWPHDGETMIGLSRLDNVQFCIEDILRNDIPGDLIETGVWRGGSTIFMRAALKAYGDETRTVWVADSFAGLPKPDPKVAPADRGDFHWQFEELAVSVDQVKANFARYGLLDDQVRFLAGWFSDTLPSAPIEKLALMRLDGDMYKSTMDALTALYAKLSPGGYCIIDDYGAIPACRQAVEEFRTAVGETAPMTVIDYSGVFWKKS